MTHDHSALIERLEATRPRFDMGHRSDQLINPDGPEAAAALRDQQAAIHAIEHAAIMLMGEVGNAFYEGFREAIGKEPWDDCYDYAAVKGRDYALEKMKAYRDSFPLPSAPNQAKEN